MAITITDQPFDPEAELAMFRNPCGDVGAIVSFTGIVRAEDDVSALILSHYPGFTEQEIDTIQAQAIKKWALDGVRIIHRVGEMRPGEVIVFVATASAHRRDAFEAADFIMDHLKSRAPFWKQEKRGDQTDWIDPRTQDKTDLKRWTS